MSVSRIRAWDDEYLSEFTKVLNDYFPEVLHKCFLINAPKIVALAFAAGALSRHQLLHSSSFQQCSVFFFAASSEPFFLICNVVF